MPRSTRKPKRKISVSNMYGKLTMLLFGSWWSVLIHSLFFLYFIIFPNNLLLTTIVSLEAIYIGIFILMAEARQEADRERKEKFIRQKDRAFLKEDVSITENVMKEIRRLKKHHSETSKTLEEIKDLLSKTNSQ